MASHRRTRLKRLLDEYAPVVAGALILLIAVGAFAAYTTTIAPGYHTEQRTTGTWSSASSFDYGATVQQASPVFERGAVRLDERVYFTRATPVLSGRFRFGLTGEGTANVTTQTQLVNYAVYNQFGAAGGAGANGTSGSGQGPTVRVWNITDPISTDRAEIQAGQAMTVPYAVDVEGIRERSARIDRAYPAASSTTDVRSAIVASVQVDGTLSGDRVNRSFEYRLPINSSEGYYVVSESFVTVSSSESTVSSVPF